MGLERELRVANEVYSMLVRQHEENKIKEAMESMSVQIVDEPNLPKRHERPKRALLLVMGGMLGMMMAALYVILLNKRLNTAH